MRLLHVITDLGIGGAEMMLLRTVAGQVRQGTRVYVASAIGGGAIQQQLESLGIPVMNLGASGRIAGWPVLRHLKRLLREISPNVVHAWMYHANAATELATLAWARHIPIVTSVHHSLDDESGAPVGRRLVRRLDALLSRRSCAVIYASSRSLTQHRRLGYPAFNACFVPNGFDVPLTTPSRQLRAEQRRRLGVDDDAFVIGTIARFAPAKDHETLLRAAAEFLALSPTARLVLVGRGITPENPELSVLLERYDLRGRCLLLGERSDLDKLFAALDIACLSSRTEGLPLSLGEAMANGLSCVATNVGDCALLLGDTGIIVPPGNPQALMDAWRRLEVMDSEERAHLGQRARRRIEQQFSMQAYLARLDEIYERALQTPAAAGSSVDANPALGHRR